MKTRLTILLVFGWVVNGFTLTAAPVHTTPSLNLPGPQTALASADLCLPQVQIEMPSRGTHTMTFTYKPVSMGSAASLQTGGLQIQQVKVDIPSKHISAPSVPQVFSPNTQRGAEGGASALPFTVHFGVRSQKSSGSSAGGGVALTSSSSSAGRGVGGPRRANPIQVGSTWNEGLWGWFDEFHNFQPNNDGGIPQAPYLTGTDALSVSDAVAPITTTPYVLMVLMACSYAFYCFQRARRTKKNEC